MKYRILYLAMLAVLAIAWSSTGARAGGDVPTTYTVDRLDDYNTSSCATPGDCSLRNAINAANLNDAADTIVFDASLFSGGPGTTTLTSNLPTITDDVTITGPGSAMLTVDADGTLVIAESAGKGVSVYRTIFDVSGDGPVDVSISGLTLTNAVKAGSGPALYAEDDDITLEDMVFSYNLTSGESYGGALYVTTGTLSVTDCMFIGNEAVDDGGAIFARGVTTIANSDFMENEAGDDGGAIVVYGDTTGISLTMTGGTVEGNYADSSGGGIYIGYTGGSAMLTGVRLFSNESGGGGGALAVGYSVGSAMLSGVTLSSNDAGGSGGAVYSVVGASNGTLDIVDSSIVHNESVGSGGGLYLLGSSSTVLVSVSDSRIEDNESTGSYGGGLYFSGNSIEISDSSVSNNTADGEGGGLRISNLYGDDKEATITNSTIAGNYSSADGGGAHIYMNTSSVTTILNTTVSGNTAANHGGGLYLDSSGGSIEITHGTITDNTADDDNEDDANGGGIYSNGDAPAVTNTIISGNDDASDVAVPGSVKGPPTLHDDCSGSITSNGVNLIDDATGCTGVDMENDLVGDEYDAGLLALTQVPGLEISIHDLGLSSDAINAADPATCADEDAIGQTRNEDACDIGAVESISVAIALYQQANDGCTIGSAGGVASSMSLLLLAVAGAFAFERRRRRG